MTDPMEKLIADALDVAGIAYVPEREGNPSRLDFLLPDHGLEIEVKRFYTPRVERQMAQAHDVIVAQGETAVRFLAHILATAPPATPSLTQASQALWEAATNEHERKHAERNPG